MTAAATASDNVKVSELAVDSGATETVVGEDDFDEEADAACGGGSQSGSGKRGMLS